MNGHISMTASTERVSSAARIISIRQMSFLFAICVLGLAFWLPAFATPAEAMLLESGPGLLSAQRVVVAHVASVDSYSDATGSIRTRVGFAAGRAILGVSPVEFELDIAGGTTGAVTVKLSETPTFSIGEDVVLFMDDRGNLLGGQNARLSVDSGRIVESGETLERLSGRVLARTTSASVRRAFPEAFGLISSATVPENQPVAQSMVAVDAQAPRVETIEPAAAPAGTPEPITIRGVGFGDAAGTVEFYYRAGQPAIVASSADIVSWSDTQIIVRVPVGTVAGYAGASAGSGPLTVVTASQVRLAPVDFEVTYGLGPARWPESMSSFYITPNCADTDSENELVLAGANAWVGTSNFNLTFAGASAQPAVGNSMNDISWAQLPEGVLGQASLMFMNGTMIEADITLNDFYTWGDATQGADFDIPTVIAHELGHWLSLRDLYGTADADKIMSGTLSYGQMRRTVSSADTAGIVRLYGAIGNTAPVTSARVTPSAWTSGTATVALSATDATPGVAATYYRVGDGARVLYDAPFEVAAEGRVRVAYFSTDLEGLTERETLATVRIDRTAPVTAIATSATESGMTLVGLAATDPLSGVGSTMYQVDGGQVSAGTSFELDPTQTHTVTFWSADNVGNVEIARTETLQPAPEDNILARISGKDRYETAAAISRATFAAGTTRNVVLATGATFADALAANGLAGALEAPVLLTPSADLHPAVIGELRRLGARDVTVVGGASAVSDDVARTIAGLGYTVSRIAGSDRYETAAMIAGQLAQVAGVEPARAFVVRGDSFADALSAAPYAYSQRIPVLLTRPDALSAATLSALQATGLRSVTVVGGTSAVGPAVVRELEAAGITVERISGDSRYATAGALLEYAIGAAWTTPEAVGVASGANFPDALGGGAAMGALHGALILTEPATLGSASTQALARCAPTANDVRVFGGIAAVTPSVMDSIAGAFGQ